MFLYGLFPFNEKYINIGVDFALKMCYNNRVQKHKTILYIGVIIMDALKKFFPLSFKRTESIGSLIIGILIYLVVGVVVGALITLSTFIAVWLPIVGPIIAWALGVISSLIGIYVLAGIIIQILVFANVIKD